MSTGSKVPEARGESIPTLRRATAVISFGLVLAFLVGCEKSASNTEQPAQTAPAVDSHSEDATALAILKMPQLWGQMCDRIGDPTVLDRVNGTASANNHPAHVVGYRFVCVSAQGNQTFTQYVGWMENRDTGNAECIHHNLDKAAVVGDGWERCGGNFKPQ
jgi:hypothetical protein